MNTTNIITIILITIAYTSFGQLTITAEDGFVPANHKSTRKFAKTVSVALPDTGRNQIWDYSNLVLCKDKSCDTSQIYFKNTNPSFPSDALMSETKTTILGIPIPEQRFNGVKNKEDFYNLGREVLPTKLSLKSITGNPLDTLVVKHRIEKSNDLIRDYPMIYGKKWTHSETDTLFYSINATTFPVNNFPLINSISGNRTREIVGEGQLILSYETSEGEIKTVTYNALLLRLKLDGEGKIYSIGERNEAIFTQMCNAIGLQKNYTEQVENYFFYVRETYASILDFYIMQDGSGKIDKIHVRSDLEQYPPRED